MQRRRTICQRILPPNHHCIKRLATPYVCASLRVVLVIALLVAFVLAGVV